MKNRINAMLKQGLVNPAPREGTGSEYLGKTGYKRNPGHIMWRVGMQETQGKSYGTYSSLWMGIISKLYVTELTYSTEVGYYTLLNVKTLPLPEREFEWCPERECIEDMEELRQKLSEDILLDSLSLPHLHEEAEELEGFLIDYSETGANVLRDLGSYCEDHNIKLSD